MTRIELAKRRTGATAYCTSSEYKGVFADSELPVTIHNRDSMRILGTVWRQYYEKLHHAELFVSMRRLRSLDIIELRVILGYGPYIEIASEINLSFDRVIIDAHISVVATNLGEQLRQSLIELGAQTVHASWADIAREESPTVLSEIRQAVLEGTVESRQNN